MARDVTRVSPVRAMVFVLLLATVGFLCVLAGTALHI